MRRALVYLHRWSGIVLGLLFVVWFASGIVLMYAPMPSLSSAERLAAAPPLDFSLARVSVADAVFGSVTPDRVRISMLGERPVYRFQQRGRWMTIFADTGSILPPLAPADASAIANRFAHANVRYDGALTDADQWTFSVRSLMPLHRVSLGDAEDTHLYISEQTAEPVMRTTASSRRWGYAGAVLHWLYFTPLRREAGTWSQLVIWLSIAGCVTALSGLVWGVWRMPRRSPYRGLLRWHHYAGLVFGLTTLTWVFSGLLSMDPWSWSPSTAATRDQRAAMSGGPLRLEPISLDAIRAAAAKLGPSLKELEVAQFKGEPFLVTDSGEALPATRAGTIPPRDLLEAAQHANPDATIIDWTMLDRYDAYYYSRSGGLPLPVLRLKFDDDVGTWWYLDPVRGTIARKEERLSRLNRWLYHGFHSLDFPFLYYRRPLWDVVVIVLSLGGLVLSATTLLPGWRRVWRRIKGWRLEAGG